MGVMETPRNAIVIAAVLAVAALGAGASSHAAGRAAACPRLADATKLPRRPGGGRLEGDVDGDGTADRATIRYAPKSLTGCGFLLVVETRNRVLVIRIPELGKGRSVPIHDWYEEDPYVAAAVRLTEDRDQIVVSRWHGASVADVSLYGLVGRELRLLRFRPRLYEDELSLFGSVGTDNTNARCSRGGPLIVVGLGPTDARDRRWLASRSRYRLKGAEIALAGTRAVRGSYRRAAAAADRWGVDGLPFTSCAVSRGRRL